MLDFAGPMVWYASESSRYESDWMAFHRFLWMNAINGENLNKLIHEVDGKKPANSESGFKWKLGKSGILGEFSDHFSRRGIQSLFGYQNSRLILNSDSFRCCPVCLESCFHSPIFLLPCVKRCPLHQVSLRNTCAYCGSSIGAVEFYPNNFREPLACQHCGKHFSSKNLAIKAIGGLGSAGLIFERIEKWMAELKSWQYQPGDFSVGEPKQPLNMIEILGCMGKLSPSPILNKKWIDFENNTIEVKDSVNFERSDFIKFNDQRRAVPLNEDMEEVCKIAKSIGRYISSQLRCCCRHQGKSHSKWTNKAQPFIAATPVVLVEVDGCPCCAVLDQWRAYAGKLMSLRNALRKQDHLIYDDQIGFYRNSYSLDPNLCAQALLSSFTWFVMEFCRLVDDSHEIGTHSGGESSKQKYYALDIYRFEISVRGFGFDGGGKKRYFMYSLNSALKELRKCHKRFMKNRLPPRSDTYGGQNNDQWYIEVSYYYQTRRSFRWGFAPHSGI